VVVVGAVVVVVVGAVVVVVATVVVVVACFFDACASTATTERLLTFSVAGRPTTARERIEPWERVRPEVEYFEPERFVFNDEPSRTAWAPSCWAITNAAVFVVNRTVVAPDLGIVAAAP